MKSAHNFCITRFDTLFVSASANNNWYKKQGLLSSFHSSILRFPSPLPKCLLFSANVLLCPWQSSIPLPPFLSYPVLVLFSVYLRWRGIVYVCRILSGSLVDTFPPDSLLLLLLPFPLLCLSLYNSLLFSWLPIQPSSGLDSGHLNISDTTQDIVLIVLKLAVAPTHRQDYIKPWSKLHNWKGQAIKNLVGIIRRCSTFYTVSTIPTVCSAT